jgi:hypothetical protein
MSRTMVLAAVCVFLASLLTPFASAGIRGPGKYCGTVVFDRWDGCTLYSGVYVMYVAEAVKEKLREKAGKSIQIDATEVDQPQNPGDGLIKNLTYIGPAPAAENGPPLEGLSLRIAPAFTDDGQARVTITLQNGGAKEVAVYSSEFAPTLLMKKKAGDRLAGGPSDGPSFARITRQAFVVGKDDEPRTSGPGWSIDAALPHGFVLKPSEKRVVTMTFDLPEGEYDFLAGYGGGVHAGEGIASNLIAFDVSEKGKAKVVKVKDR